MDITQSPARSSAAPWLALWTLGVVPCAILSAGLSHTAHIPLLDRLSAHLTETMAISALFAWVPAAIWVFYRHKHQTPSNLALATLGLSLGPPASFIFSMFIPKAVTLVDGAQSAGLTLSPFNPISLIASLHPLLFLAPWLTGIAAAAYLLIRKPFAPFPAIQPA